MSEQDKLPEFPSRETSVNPSPRRVTSALPGRERSPVPLSPGFGFGAAAIREHAKTVARAATERKESRVRELLSEPVYNAAPATLAPSPAVAPILRAPTARTPAPQRAMYTPPLPRAATRGRSFFAWVLDAIVAASAFVIAMGANYALVPEGIAEPVAEGIAASARILGAENPYLFALLIRVLLSTMVLVFVGQMVVLLLAGSTAGRYAMGIFVRRAPWKRRLPDSVFAALSEAVTVGGILTFPLLFLMPSRAHVTPWVRYEQTE